jgi:hypothetical protein
MNPFATAAVAATLLAFACTAGAWQEWEFTGHKDPRQDAGREGRQQELDRAGVGYAFPAADEGADRAAGFGHNLYGWSYLYAFPAGAPRLAGQTAAREGRR